jgi:hypothetical protein
VTVVSAAEPQPTLPGAAEHKLAQIRREGYFGGAGLLASDARVVSLFANEARRRTMRRLFGIPVTDKSGLVTLIALVTLADAARRQMEGISAPNPPTLPGVLAGVGLVKELAFDVAGPWSRESPFFGTLLAYAVMGTAARFALRKSVRGIRAASHETRREFDHRYGHLIRPNRPRPGA